MSFDLDPTMFASVMGAPCSATVYIAHAGTASGLRTLECMRADDGAHVFEGDIVVQPAHAVISNDTLKGMEKVFGHGVSDVASLWSGGIVPYACHQALQDLVRAAMAHWEARTPIRFLAYDGAQDDYVVFHPGSRNESEVGRTGGQQRARIVAGTTVGTVVHEIGHVLGLWHEHSRSDRDEYIDLHPANFNPRDKMQFDQCIKNARDLGAYDYASIMHYPTTAFTCNDKPTITAKNGQPIGQRDGLSQGDVSAVRTLYPELDWK